MDSMNDLLTKDYLKRAIRLQTLRISMMIGLMVAVLLAATYIMARGAV